MPHGYSDDLRRQALRYLDRGHSQSETCDVFGMSRATLNDWLRRRREKGDFRRRAGGKPQPMYRIDADKLCAYTDAHPDAYLHEIANEFGVSAAGIFYACKRLGITRKKNRAVSGA